MFVGAAKLSAGMRFGGQLWVFPLRNLLSCEVEQHGGKRKPQLRVYFPRVVLMGTTNQSLHVKINCDSF